MSDGRLRISSVRGGSSARSVEQAEASESVGPIGRVRAGSAARMAEDAKRQGAALGAGTAGFTLRGQGGLVVRQSELASAAPAAAPMVDEVGSASHPDRLLVQNATRSASAYAKTTATEGVEPVTDAPLKTTAGRLQTFFRALFKPGGPSPE